jgi:hypothetical protein
VPPPPPGSAPLALALTRQIRRTDAAMRRPRPRPVGCRGDIGTGCVRGKVRGDEGKPALASTSTSVTTGCEKRSGTTGISATLRHRSSPMAENLAPTTGTSATLRHRSAPMAENLARTTGISATHAPEPGRGSSRRTTAVGLEAYPDPACPQPPLPSRSSTPGAGPPSRRPDLVRRALLSCDGDATAPTRLDGVDDESGELVGVGAGRPVAGSELPPGEVRHPAVDVLEDPRADVAVAGGDDQLDRQRPRGGDRAAGGAARCSAARSGRRRGHRGRSSRG